MVLGFWQLNRLGQKEALISEFTNHVEQNVTVTSTHLKDQDLYKTINLQGSFIKNPIFYYMNYQGKPVFEILQPFKTSCGKYFLVSRGYVEKKQELLPFENTTNVSLTGYLVRSPEKKPLFIENDLKQNEWFYLNRQHLKEFFDVDNFQSFIILPKGTSNLLGKQIDVRSKVKFRNDHMQYAITWFSLSLVTFIIAIVLRRKKA